MVRDCGPDRIDDISALTVERLLLINQNRNRLAVARFRDEALKTPYRYGLIRRLRVAGDYDEENTDDRWTDWTDSDRQ